MRRLVVTENLTLDGVAEAPERWFPPYQSDDVAAANGLGRDATDALLLGRRTYEALAGYWPHQRDDEGGITAYLNGVAKFVVSSTLERADWVNTTLLRGDVATEVAELKRRPGGTIGVIGSPTLVRALLHRGLVDELRLLVCPLLLGSGERLFDDTGRTELELIETRTFESGVVGLTYAPRKAGAAEA